ncbi:hypothetical protein H0H28_11635, partial [Corynebacterium sanguinis]|nr:hypothetical protein [Corynebacterium sanguinis]
MAGKTAFVSIRIVSDANNRGFKKAAEGARRMSKSLAKITAITAAVGGLSGAIGSLGIGLAAVGTLGVAAIAPLALGFEGVKAAAGSAAEGFSNLRSVAASALQSSMVPGFEALNGFMLAIAPQMEQLSTAVGKTFSGIAQHIASPEITAGFQSLMTAAGDFIAGTQTGINQLISGFAAMGPALAPVAADLGAAFGDMIGSIGRA